MINDKQTTHTASVHRSASLSAINLYSLYAEKITNAKIDAVILEISEYLDKLNTPENVVKPAKRFIEKIISYPSYYKYTDPISNITVRQLLGLTFLASQDEQNLNPGVTAEDALKKFTEAMFEIQRGYNLNDKGEDIDPSTKDLHVCPAGSFNKLIEKLSGIHKKVELVFITKDTALLKLPIIVNNVVSKYLKEYKDTVNKNTFKALISEIEENGIKEILPKIKTEISDLFFEEFKSLCGDEGKNNNFFIECLNNIIYIDLSKSIDKLKSTMQSEEVEVKDFQSRLEAIAQQKGIFPQEVSKFINPQQNLKDIPRKERECNTRRKL